MLLFTHAESPVAPRPDENPSARSLLFLRDLRKRYQADLERVRDRVEQDVSDADVEELADREARLEQWLSSITDWIEHLERFNAYDAPEAFPEFAPWVAEEREAVYAQLAGLRERSERDPEGFAAVARRGSLVTGPFMDLLELVGFLPTGESLVLDAVRLPDQDVLWSPVLRAFGAWSRSQLEGFLYAVVAGLDDVGLLYQALPLPERLVFARILR